MLKLDAVNICIRALGDPAVTALDTGGTSDAGEAEVLVDRQNIVIQRQGWACNMRTGVVLTLPNLTVAASAGTGTFTYGETVTQTSTGATGTFYYEEGGLVYLLVLTGTFTSGASTIHNAGSTVTRVSAAVATITEAKHAIPESVFLSATPLYQWPRFSIVGEFAYDLDEDTTTFSGNFTINATVLRTFAQLPGWLQELIAWEAAAEFQIYKKRGVTDDRYIDRSLSKARAIARREDQDIRRHSLIPRGDSTRRVPIGPMP